MDSSVGDPREPEDEPLGDEPDDGRPRGTAWAAPIGAVVLGVVATVGLGAWAAAAADPPGRLLGGLATVAIAVITGIGALARPRLAATRTGLTMRGAFRARTWPWLRVDSVRVVRLRRMGLPASYVEVEARDDDGNDRLLVLGRLELGADPVDVVADLQHHRAEAGRSERDPDGT